MRGAPLHSFHPYLGSQDATRRDSLLTGIVVARQATYRSSPGLCADKIRVNAITAASNIVSLQPKSCSRQLDLVPAIATYIPGRKLKVCYVNNQGLGVADVQNVQPVFKMSVLQ